MSEKLRDENFFLENIVVYELAIYNFLLSITEDSKVSEDLLQNTMEKAWGNLSQLREPLKAQSWLFSIAKNEANKYYRYHKNLYSYIEDIDFSSDLQMDNEYGRVDVLESLVRNFDVKAMSEALKLLEGKYRRLIVMYYFQEIKQKEIAEILNQNYSTVRVNLVRGLRKVRKIHEKIEKGEIDINIK